MQSARHLSQIADLRRKLSAQRKDARRSEEQRVAMARDYLNQITEVAKESSLKDEELRKLREQYRRRGQIDQANNLQQRDRDWVINQNEVNVQIRRDQNLGKERGELSIVGNFVDAGADPGFFSGGGALVSSNKPHSFFFAEYQLY